MKNLLIIILAIVLNIVATSLIIYGTFKEDKPKEPHICEHFELEVLYWQRLKEYHSGEINEKQYRDSIYNDVQKHFIFKK